MTTDLSHIAYDHHPTGADEAAVLADEVRTMLDEGVEPGDIAVLFRTYTQTARLEEAFRNAAIPFQIVGAKGFWNRACPKAVAAYLTVLAGVSGEEGEKALVYACQRPTRYIANKTVEMAGKASPSDPIMGLLRVNLKRNQQRGAEVLVSQIKAARKRVGTDTIADILRDLADETGLRDWLIAQPGEDSDTADTNGGGQVAVLDQVIEVSKTFDTDLAAFVEYIMAEQASAVGAAADASPDKVTMMTLHRSKGLEWPVVILPGVSDGILPHRNAASPAQVEEERRLWYVGITRARDYCRISSVDMHEDKPCGPSIFLTEGEVNIPEEFGF